MSVDRVQHALGSLQQAMEAFSTREYYEEKVWVSTPRVDPPAPKPRLIYDDDDGQVTVSSGGSSVGSYSSDFSHAYNEAYDNKAWMLFPGHWSDPLPDVDWYTVSDEPYVEPPPAYEPRRKEKSKTWKRKTRQRHPKGMHNQLHQRMRHRRRR